MPHLRGQAADGADIQAVLRGLKPDALSAVERQVQRVGKRRGLLAVGLAFLMPDSYPASEDALLACAHGGKEGGVMNREKYAQSLAYYPADFTELVLGGGNHANFGDYGAQKGDGEATIARSEQIERTADAIAALIR